MNRGSADCVETDRNHGERGLIRDRIVGAWELVEYSMTSTEGEVHHSLGPDARGLILYTADGFMSAQLMNPDRPRFRSSRVHAGEPNELSAAAAGYLAYSGPYRIDEGQGVVYHGMSVALFPNWVGEEGARWVQFDGDRMTLTARQQVFGNRTWKPVVLWRRAQARDAIAG
ncbi:lipocalin-like domain-containing protein [Mycolicibacterium farcinogenes]|nr:lipocalin-like domain-containing protein [Mycolicibacterium farcinogenes]